MRLGDALMLGGIVALMVGFSSCAHFSEHGHDLEIEIPDSYGSQGGEAPRRDAWWRTFGDKKLNELVSEALSDNPGLLQAVARLKQARALARKAGADQIPTLNIEGSALRSRTIGTDPAGTTTQTKIANQFGLDLAASYEVDLWGRINSLKWAALADAEASRNDLDTVVTTLAAQIAQTWYELASASEQLDLLDDQLESSARQLELVELRYESGQITSLDVWQQRGQLADLRARKPSNEKLIINLRHKLAVLVGRMPSKTNDFQTAELPHLEPSPQIGVPGDLLINRPDLRSALQRVWAADERVATAIANRLPSLRLSASAGYSTREISDLFDEWVAGLSANLLAPVIDWGRRIAEVERARSVLRERIEKYKEVLLQAVSEVEDALVSEQRQNETVSRQAKQLNIYRQTFKQASLRYQSGLNDYLAVLRALESRQSLERNLVNSRLQLVTYRISLYRALGGDFSGELDLQAMDE